MKSNLHFADSLEKIKSVENIENPKSGLQSAQAADVMDHSVPVMTQSDTD